MSREESGTRQSWRLDHVGLLDLKAGLMPWAGAGKPIWSVRKLTKS
jgi:hypothetical protein